MREFLNITKALSDENRLRILMFLRDGELCLCQIIKMLGLASSTVSKHMSILVQAGLVQARKEGRMRYFKWAGAQAPPPVKEGLQWIEKSLARDKTIAKDKKNHRAMLKIPVEKVCAAFTMPRKK